jgi:hypothetical protein
VLATLQIHGFPAWRNNTGAARYQGLGDKARFVRFGMPGAPDVMGLVPGSGRMLAIECKRSSGGRLSEAQFATLSKVHRLGGLAMVVATSEDLRQLDNYLRVLQAHPTINIPANW